MGATTESTAHRTERWRDAWTTRPARSRQDRMVAGVATALARRYAVDPVLMRVAFVAAAFYGPGIPLYLVGCVVLPDAARTARGRFATVAVSALLVVAAVLLATVLLGSDGGWVAPLIVCLGLLAALHVTRGDLAEPAAPAVDGPATAPAGSPNPDTPGATTAAATTATPTTATPTTAAPTTATPTTATPTATTATTATTTPTAGDTATTHRESGPPATPPAWDPLGAAPFAWDLPEPGREPEPEEPPSRVTPITLSLALLVGAAVAVVALAVPGPVSPAAAPAAALAVVGVGLVIGSFRHAGRWLLPFAVLLGTSTWLVSAVPFADLDRGVGSIAEAPRSVAAVAPEYARGVGDVSLDLSGLDLSGPPGGPAPVVRTTARVGIGSVVVTVPPDADLVVRGSAELGDVTVDGQNRGGTRPSLSVEEPGADGPGGGRIELDVRAGMGSVAVNRG